eukprot:CAMPEP_0205860754 /NCGR_PEP_ID=MMETSP1083-20121108/5399_1 /ASSEMBLY_ACC=CAM_ASM_000430 /TAXON_ID=97485 /ORGANISM="Prymnesium parvum, Strain Texoma1" /LENGTH=63 /DNA_ID=CAMNT_0053222401 /DNA_START=1242 /DNA_END=1433 /DNA_ORIENTATION=-
MTVGPTAGVLRGAASGGGSCTTAPASLQRRASIRLAADWMSCAASYSWTQAAATSLSEGVSDE